MVTGSLLGSCRTRHPTGGIAVTHPDLMTDPSLPTGPDPLAAAFEPWIVQLTRSFPDCSVMEISGALRKAHSMFEPGTSMMRIASAADFFLEEACGREVRVVSASCSLSNVLPTLSSDGAQT